MPTMTARFLVSLVLLAFVLYPLRGAEALDPYKVLGVDKNANQREIQKAFHRLSLQYHPDKNKNKSAQEKFAEINNAYEILSDEEKRKNYDLYGDEKGTPGSDSGNFGGGNFGNREGYTYFTSGGPGDSRFTFRPDGWQQMGGQGSSKSFSFSFGGDPGIGSGSFDFGFGDIFSNFFGGHSKSGSQFGNVGGSSYGASSGSSAGTLRDINMQTFKKEIAEQGLTWLLLFYTPTDLGYQVFDSVVGDTANLLHGAIKAGRINCQKDQAFCKDLGVWPSKSARLFLYSYASAERGSLVEYNGEYDTISLKSFCQNHLPRFSKRVSLRRFQFPSSTEGNLPQVLLLSNKKDTPAIWRVLSGLYRKRVVFFDAEVGDDVTDEELRRFKVHALPAVVGRLSNGEEYTLKAGISVKDLSTGISEMKTLLDNFEKRNKKAAPSQGKRSETETGKAALPHLSASNVDSVCGDKTPICLVGVFRSFKAKEKIKQILSLVSQKTLMRRQYNAESDSISYSLLDAKKQAPFLNAFDKSWHKRSDELLLLAYKPRKGKFAAYTDEMTLEEVERFIGSVLNGDVHFSKVRHRPVLQ